MFKLTRLAVEMFVRTLLVTIAVYIFAKFTSFDLNSFDGWVIRIAFMLWAVIFPFIDFWGTIEWKKKKKSKR